MMVVTLRVTDLQHHVQPDGHHSLVGHDAMLTGNLRTCCLHTLSSQRSRQQIINQRSVTSQKSVTSSSGVES